jgi:hypothetical protein
MSLRKVIKTRGSFPNEEAALKLLYLGLERVAKKWTRPVQDWKAALNRFAIVYQDRLPRGGVGVSFGTAQGSGLTRRCFRIAPPSASP